MSAPNKQAFLVTHEIQTKGKFGKKKQIVLANAYENQRVSNYDLLLKLGFDKDLI
jgi:hypothetical protein